MQLLLKDSAEHLSIYRFNSNLDSNLGRGVAKRLYRNRDRLRDIR
jgi:hypothetical protein